MPGSPVRTLSTPSCSKAAFVRLTLDFFLEEEDDGFLLVSVSPSGDEEEVTSPRRGRVEEEDMFRSTVEEEEEGEADDFNKTDGDIDVVEISGVLGDKTDVFLTTGDCPSGTTRWPSPGDDML